MSDMQDKPADLVEENNTVVDSDAVVESDEAPVTEQIEADFEEFDPLAGLDMIKQLAEAQAEIANLKDQMLRTVADGQNTKRRAEQDVTKARKFGTEKFATEMLPVVDSLGMALQNKSENDSDAVKALNEGVEMTLNMLLSALEKFNVLSFNIPAVKEAELGLSTV